MGHPLARKETTTMIRNDEITLDVATPGGTYHGAFLQNTKVDIQRRFDILI